MERISLQLFCNTNYFGRRCDVAKDRRTEQQKCHLHPEAFLCLGHCFYLDLLVVENDVRQPDVFRWHVDLCDPAVFWRIPSELVIPPFLETVQKSLLWWLLLYDNRGFGKCENVNCQRSPFWSDPVSCRAAKKLIKDKN